MINLFAELSFYRYKRRGSETRKGSVSWHGSCFLKRPMEIKHAEKGQIQWPSKNARTATANATLNKVREYLREVKLTAAIIVQMRARAAKSVLADTQVAAKTARDGGKPPSSD